MTDLFVEPDFVDSGFVEDPAATHVHDLAATLRATQEFALYVRAGTGLRLLVTKRIQITSDIEQ